jgi:Recombination endonuclease VII
MKTVIQEHHKTRRNRVALYGISPKEFDQLMLDQDGKCAICKVQGATHLDHDHKTNKVRGILCRWCNSGLGYFHDDFNRLLAAMEYLIASDHAVEEEFIEGGVQIQCESGDARR